MAVTVIVAQIAPLLLSLVLGLLVGLVTSRLHGARSGGDARAPLDAFQRNDHLLLAMLVLAAFSLGAFLAYTFVNVRP